MSTLFGFGIPKWARATPLVLLSVATSVTIVADASEWYGALYRDRALLGVSIGGELRGLVFAIILEAFLAVMMAVRVPGRPDAKWWAGRHHPMNILMSVVALACAAVIFYGTWQGIIEGKESRFRVPNAVQDQIDAVEQAIEQNRVAQQRFAELEQPGNLALAAREGRRLSVRLETLLSRTESTTDTGRLQLWFLAVAKLVMLLANVISLWLVGWVFRQSQVTDESGSVPFGHSETEDTFSEPDVSEPMWTRADFMGAFRRLQVTSEEVLQSTGLEAHQLASVVNHTYNVLNFIEEVGKDVQADSETVSPGEEAPQDGQSGEETPEIAGPEHQQRRRRPIVP